MYNLDLGNKLSFYKFLSIIADEPLDSSASASQSIESAYHLDHQQSGIKSSKATDHSHNGADVGVDMNVGQCVNCYFVEKRNQELKKIVNKKLERIDTLERKLQLAQQKIQRLQSAKTAKSNLVKLFLFLFF